MFSQALSVVQQFTFPVIMSKRLANGSVHCGCATFIVLNPDGWILTAAHILEDAILAQQHQHERSEYDAKRKQILEAGNLSAQQRRKQIARLPQNREWIVNNSYWWGNDASRLDEFAIDKLADLAYGRIRPFDGSSIRSYPVFRDPTKELPVGTSLCRLGFPFSRITATFDEVTNSFRIAEGVLPMPRFPNDGIHTRIVRKVDAATGREIQFVETSSPGLRGQSGGPIFDVNAHVCALQSSTVHLPLGFSPAIKQGTKEIVEHQFMHVGIGAHVQEIIQFLDRQKVAYTVAK